MQFLKNILPFVVLVTGAFGRIKNTTREFQLKTVVSPGQTGKASFNNLWVETYHTGAGQDDVVLSSNRSTAPAGFLNATGTTGSGKKFSNMVFDFGSDFPWGLVLNPSVAYAAWQPSAINAGAVGKTGSVDGFFINSTGLQWTNAPSAVGGPNDAFGGWLVCDWWHEEPQLFFILSFYNPIKVSAGCARVQLQPVYI